MLSPGLKIDGDYLVIPTLVALPERCVRTNEPVSPREYKYWDLPFIPGWLLVLMFTAPFFLFLGPFIAKHRCRFKAGLSKSIWRRYMLRKALAVGIIVASPTLCILLLYRNPSFWGPFAILVGVFGFLGGFLILNLYTHPLIVYRYEANQFWIKGCSKEYLASLEQS